MSILMLLLKLALVHVWKELKCVTVHRVILEHLVRCVSFELLFVTKKKNIIFCICVTWIGEKN